MLVSCPEHRSETILFFPHDRKIDTVEPLLWDTSVQGTSPFRGDKIWSRKNVHIIFEFVNSVVGTPPFRGKGHFFWVPKPGLNLHTKDSLALKRD